MSQAGPFAAPLSWPLGQPRTAEKRTPHGMKSGVSATTFRLLRELKLMRATSVILSTNLPVRRDGMPYADDSDSALALPDPGVAAYFTRNEKPFVVACDSYSRVDHNLNAVALTIEALRSIERHGSHFLDRAMSGFLQLPEATDRPWWVVLGVAEGASYHEVTTAYVNLMKICHPDQGGSHERASEVNRAYSQAKGAKR